MISKYILNTPILKGERGLKICPLDPLWWTTLSGPTYGDDALKDTLRGVLSSVRQVSCLRDFLIMCTGNTKTLLHTFWKKEFWKISESPLGSFFPFLKNYAFTMR